MSTDAWGTVAKFFGTSPQIEMISFVKSSAIVAALICASRFRIVVVVTSFGCATGVGVVAVEVGAAVEAGVDGGDAVVGDVVTVDGVAG
jgi:hypothetical protein